MANDSIQFTLKAKHGTYENATIEIGEYRKVKPDDPAQTGWRVLTQHGEPVGSPTVNLWSPPVFPSSGCVFIKITDEFQGWIESLEGAGIIERTGRIEPAGYVERYAEECRVLKPELLVGEKHEC